MILVCYGPNRNESSTTVAKLVWLPFGSETKARVTTAKFTRRGIILKENLGNLPHLPYHRYSILMKYPLEQAEQ